MAFDRFNIKRSKAMVKPEGWYSGERTRHLTVSDEFGFELDAYRALCSFLWCSPLLIRNQLWFNLIEVYGKSPQLVEHFRMTTPLQNKITEVMLLVFLFTYCPKPCSNLSASIQRLPEILQRNCIV